MCYDGVTSFKMQWEALADGAWKGALVHSCYRHDKPKSCVNTRKYVHKPGLRGDSVDLQGLSSKPAPVFAATIRNVNIMCEKKHQLAMLMQEDMMLRAVRFLDTMIQRDNLQKASFLKDLGQIWTRVDGRVVKFRMLPPLLAEARTEALQPILLPLLLSMLERQSNEVRCSSFDWLQKLHARLCQVTKHGIYSASSLA